MTFRFLRLQIFGLPLSVAASQLLNVGKFVVSFFWLKIDYFGNFAPWHHCKVTIHKDKRQETSSRQREFSWVLSIANDHFRMIEWATEKIKKKLFNPKPDAAIYFIVLVNDRSSMWMNGCIARQCIGDYVIVQWHRAFLLCSIGVFPQPTNPFAVDETLMETLNV